ncbi:MAG TPA: cupin domain-containing protein [Pseudonocardia sp.]|nr:cupin domain-containing protein [Pseudonocardia sp.]
MTFQDPAEEHPSGDGPGRTSPPAAGHTYRVVADRASTAGGYSLTEATSAPGACVPLHAHDDAVECFYVIEGEYRLTVSGAVHHLRAGDLLLVPRGAPHQFEVLGREQGRALEVYAPAGFEPLPELFGRRGPHWRLPDTRPGAALPGTTLPGTTRSGTTRPGPPLPGPKAVVFAGASRDSLGQGGPSGAASAAMTGEVRTTLVVSLRSDVMSGASWRVGPGATAVWVLAGRYRLETEAGPVALGEGEIFSMEGAGDTFAVSAAPSSRALILLL